MLIQGQLRQLHFDGVQNGVHVVVTGSAGLHIFINSVEVYFTGFVDSALQFAVPIAVTNSAVVDFVFGVFFVCMLFVHCCVDDGQDNQPNPQYDYSALTLQILHQGVVAADARTDLQTYLNQCLCTRDRFFHFFFILPIAQMLFTKARLECTLQIHSALAIGCT